MQIKRYCTVNDWKNFIQLFNRFTFGDFTNWNFIPFDLLSISLNKKILISDTVCKNDPHSDIVASIILYELLNWVEKFWWWCHKYFILSDDVGWTNLQNEWCFKHSKIFFLGQNSKVIAAADQFPSFKIIICWLLSWIVMK